jgi:arginine exporter protein ArgO
MKKVTFTLIAIIMAILFTGHFHSFVIGFSLAMIAVTIGYYIAYQAILKPQYTMSYLVLAVVSKLTITVAGIIGVFTSNIIHSPITFLIAYVLFSVLMTYLASTYRSLQREKKDNQQQEFLRTGLYKAI